MKVQRSSSKNIDRFIIAFSALAILLAIWLLGSEDLWRKDRGERSGRVSATLVESRGDVRVKVSEDLAWTSLGNRREFSEGDQIFNGTDSLSVIEVKDSKIHLGEETVVEINFIDDVPELILEKGNMTAEVTGKMRIRFGKDGPVEVLDGTKSMIKVSSVNGVPKIEVIEDEVVEPRKIEAQVEVEYKWVKFSPEIKDDERFEIEIQSENGQIYRIKEKNWVAPSPGVYAFTIYTYADESSLVTGKSEAQEFTTEKLPVISAPEIEERTVHEFAD